jgi:predicted ATPase/DNA-binding SARP family transcriptional activator
VDFLILGPLEVLDAGRDVTPSRPKQRALLALLLLRAGDLVTVDEAVDALWGALAPPTARNALQGHISALRKILGAGRIDTRDGYRLLLEDDELDLDRFERLLVDAQGRAAEERCEILAEALSLFRGAPLADFRYESFAQAALGRLEELRLNALEGRIDAELALRRHAEVVPELERLSQEQPLREGFHAQLMLALYRSGRQADALDVYQRARRALGELGLEPGGPLRTLERRILEHDPTLELPPETRTRLPLPPTPLLGRDRELADGTALLLRSDVHIVTLVGAGGVGKTRLALELARRNGGRFQDGVAYVGLASLTDASLVIETIARAVAQRDSARRSAFELVKEHFGSRETLLVLDNLEHLLEVVPILGELVAAAPRLKLLATSREPLRMYGEHLFPVPPLDPDAAADLFLDRAQAVRPDLHRAAARATATVISAQLDRLPLAIELAAAHMAVLDPDDLLERLADRLTLLVAGPRDHPERQQTLRNTLAWSHDLLAPNQQSAFARLSVFAGGWTLDAAAEVCGEDVALVADITSLEDKNLVQLTTSDPEPRFTMLETIREYAAERLLASGDRDAVWARHAEYFLALAERVEPALPSSRREVLDRLELDHDNIRAAIAYLTSIGEHERVLRLAGSIWRFWYLRGHLREGRLRVETALEHGAARTLARAKALNGAAAMAVNAGDIATARVRAEEALVLHRSLGDDVGAAYSGFMLANALVAQQELDRARELYEESIAVFGSHGEDAWSLLASRHLAYLYDQIGNRAQAHALHAQNLQQARASGNDRFIATSLSALADHALDEGRAEQALELLAESLTIHYVLGDVLDTAVDLALFTTAMTRTGDFETTTCLAAALDAGADDIGVRRNAVTARIQDALADARAHLDPTTYDEAWERGHELTLREAVALALRAVPRQR